MSKNIYKPATLIILVFLVILLPKEIKAQQEPGLTQYMNNPMSFNPAYAGTKDAISGVMQSRLQWVGFDGAPQTHIFSLHSPAPIFEDFVGLGFHYAKDKIGPLEHDDFFLSYSYRMIVHEGGMLSFGLSSGIETRKVGLSSLNYLDRNDPTYYTDVNEHTSLNFGFGAFYYTDDYYVGLSIPKLRSVTYNEDMPMPEDDPWDDRETYQRHFFLTGGYIYDLDPEWTIRPSLLAKYTAGTPLSMDLNVTARYQDMIAAGLGYRFGDSFGAMVQVLAYQYIWVGYAYDFGVTGLRHHNRGTHEITLSFDFNLQGGSIEEPSTYRFY